MQIDKHSAVQPLPNSVQLLPQMQGELLDKKMLKFLPR